MSFSIDMAKLVADQLSRLVTLNRHQLAGQVANLDFWLGQVKNAFDVLDGYGKRFKQMKTAQGKHIAENHTVEFDFIDPCCTQQAPALPVKVPDAELKTAKAGLCNGARRFLVRCHNENFVGESKLRDACARFGISVDPADLKPRQTRGARVN